jgi:hypothetical protein
MCELRLDVLHFVRLCQAYHLKASDLIKDLEEEPSPDDSSLAIQRYYCAPYWSLFCRIFPFTNQGLIGI